MLAAVVAPGDLTLVVNTADDLWLHGLRICPDLDTTLYALADRQDVDRGWGLRDESFRCMDALRGLGQEVWFNLGDRDLATHLYRTGMLRAGHRLAAVTQRLAAAMGVTVTVLPMTEDEVATEVETADGEWRHYEEFLVRHGAALTVTGVRYATEVERLEPAPGVLAALSAADLVVIAPSNPLASIAPILEVPGIRAAVAAAPEVVAVAPIVSGVPITDPGERRRADSRSALLAATGATATAAGVARLYANLCHRYVLDEADADEAAAVAKLGVQPVLAPTLLHRGGDASRFLNAVLGHDHRPRYTLPTHG